ncbi:unnamed protein product [Amoebophrya sp. A120]|nr:unnamed protein product [Amoebophrya sp. A120]|eukprot:GSA120T00006412001.1
MAPKQSARGKTGKAEGGSPGSKKSGGGGGPSADGSVSEAELQEFREIFHLIDSDGSGEISKEELGNLIRILGIKVSSTELQLILNEIGSSSQTGEIGFEDFVRTMTCKISADYTPDEVRRSFELFSEHDEKAPPGCIKLDDLSEACKRYGSDGRTDIQEIINRLQTTNNYFNYDNYVAMTMK